MGDVTNLRWARKLLARQRDAEAAAENRVLHGLTKAERLREKARRDKVDQTLEGHRLGSGEANEVSSRQAIDRDRRTQDERQP
ncbi:MAG: DUF4169 family protein [Pseudorhodoplanes sp.]|nr:DUF4169 family protein [Pseudorhodoplanes sp.]